MTKQAFDFTKATEDFMGAFKIDTKVFDEAIKNAAEFNTKLVKIALTTAKKNAELTTAWTTETLKKVEAANKVQKEAGDYVAVATDLAKEQIEALPEKLTAYVDVAKAAQQDATELFVAAGKDIQAEVVAKTKEAGKKAA
jgi:hypothetical protein